MHCPNCGSPVKEGRFCNYCGAKLPDDTTRVEVNVNKRIEDVAEMKRADYETEESKLRQKQEARKYKARSTRRISILVLLVISVIGAVIGIVTNPKGDLAILVVFAIVVAAFMVVYTIALLISGKW